MNPKYKIVITEGCINYSLMINDKIIDEKLPQEEMFELVDYLCEKFKKELVDDNVSINDLVNCFRPYYSAWDRTICDTCGDSTHITEWQL
jgi:hypothetical protein